jgi:hypothetical protein
VAGDGLHPSGKQYALWVEAVLSFIKQAITHEADMARFHFIPSNEVMITPNPASDMIEVLYRNRRPQTVRIMNISGKMISEEKPTGYSLHMNLHDYKPGIYWLESSFSDNRSVVPFIVIN